MSGPAPAPTPAEPRRAPLLDPPDRRRDTFWVLVTFTVLGLVGGVVWQWVAPAPTVLRTAQGAVLDQAQLGVKIGADGWFAVVGAVGGLLGGFALVRRRRDAVLVVVLGAAASVGAAYLCLWLGTTLADVPPERFRDLPVGSRATGPLQLISSVVVLAWPLGFLVAAVAALRGAGRDETRP